MFDSTPEQAALMQAQGATCPLASIPIRAAWAAVVSQLPKPESGLQGAFLLIPANPVFLSPQNLQRGRSLSMSSRTRILFGIRISLLATLLLILPGCTVTNDTLERYGSEGNSEKLLGYIQKHHDDDEKRDLVKFAMEQIVKNDLPDGIDYLRKNITSLSDPDYVSYVVNLRNPVNGSRTFLQNYLIDWLKGVDGFNIKVPFVADVNYLVNASDLDLQRKEKSKEFISSIADTKLEASAFETEINEMRDDSSKLVAQISDYESQLELAVEELDSTRDFIRNETFHRSGQIIHQPSFQLYEIALPRVRQHALLKTTKTVFNSEGWFSLQVRHGGTTPVEVYGGFVQEWNIYVEVDMEYYDELIARLRIEADSLRLSIPEQENNLTDLTKACHQKEIEYKRSHERVSALGDSLLSLFEN
jgi:hypothetical protein